MAEFSTGGDIPENDKCLESWGQGYKVTHLAPSEGHVYHVLNDT